MQVVFDHQLKNFFLSIATTAELCIFRDMLCAADKADCELIIAAAHQGGT